MPFGPIELKEISGVNTGDLVPIPSRHGYYITKTGRVFSVRELSQRKWPDGYMRVSLGGSIKKKTRAGRHGAGVHRLMAIVFLKRDEGKDVVRHLDGNPTNNVLENLAWGSHKENSGDMIRHGKSRRGQKNNTTVLTEQQVLEIRRREGLGGRATALAKEYGVSKSTVYAIVKRLNWAYLNEPEISDSDFTAKAGVPLRVSSVMDVEKVDLW